MTHTYIPSCPVCGNIGVDAPPYSANGLRARAMAAMMRCTSGHLYRVRAVIDDRGEVTIEVESQGI